MGNCFKRSTTDDISLLRGTDSVRETSSDPVGPPSYQVHSLTVKCLLFKLNSYCTIKLGSFTLKQYCGSSQSNRLADAIFTKYMFLRTFVHRYILCCPLPSPLIHLSNIYFKRNFARLCLCTQLNRVSQLGILMGSWRQ